MKQEDQKPVLNSVWITRVVDYDRQFSPAEGGFPRGYNVIAHELGHILLNTDHIQDHQIHNLMHASAFNLNGRLTRAQCASIKSSPLVKELELDEKICPESSSSLRSQVHFIGAKKDCKKAGDIIDLLTKVQDSVSDLTPAHGIDFYFADSGNDIFYKDNGIFELALETSYDYYGRQILLPKQAHAQQIHELGHLLSRS